jgi:hypothetical protein
MKLELNKKELEHLTEIAIMANWLMTAHDVEEEERKQPYLELIHKIYKVASENGNKNIEYFEDLKIFEPNADWEDSTMSRKFIEEFEQQTFWEELVNKLADREMRKDLKGRKPKDFDEQFEIYEEHAASFAKEFQEHGVSRIEIAGKTKKTG